MLVFWDIDGTLLTTGRAGIFAWQEALREVDRRTTRISRRSTPRGIPTSGSRGGCWASTPAVAEPDDPRCAALVRRYEDRLPAALSPADRAAVLAQRAGDPRRASRGSPAPARCC